MDPSRLVKQSRAAHKTAGPDKRGGSDFSLKRNPPGVRVWKSRTWIRTVPVPKPVCNPTIV
jgi:hypothetical protein